MKNQINNLTAKISTIEKLGLDKYLEIYNLYQEISSHGSLQNDYEADDLFSDDAFLTGYLKNLGCFAGNEIEILSSIQDDCKKSYYS